MKKSVYTLLQSKSKTWSLQWFTSLFFLALFAFPLFPLKVTNVILIAFSASTLISFLIHPIPIKKIVLHNLVFVIPFLPYLIEYSIFSFNPEAHFEFEKKLFFFTAPFFIPVFIQITGFKNYRLPLMIFAISLCVLTTYTLLILSYKGIPFINTNYENGTYILRENFERISGLHPTYYSIFALSSACCLLLHFATSKTWLRLLSIFLAIMLVITVLLLAVKIAFITIAVFLVTRIIKTNINPIRKLALGSFAIAAFMLTLFTVPSLNKRMMEIASWQEAQSIDNNTVSQRVSILNCSLQVFSEHLLVGTGSRNFQKELDNCYQSKAWGKGNEQHFNPHNQFLSIGINYGMVTMLAFLVCLFLIFKKIRRFKEGIYFALAIFLFFLSESMLERQMGIFFFGLIALLLYNNNSHSISQKSVLL